MAELIAAATTAANSADVAVANGEAVTFFLKNAVGGAADGAVALQIKDAGGRYYDLIELNRARPMFHLTTPGTYRVRKPVTDRAIGVDYIAVGTATATIANGASLSSAVDCTLGRPNRIVMPAAWTAAVLTVQTSYDGTNFNNLYDIYGAEYTIQAAASRSILLPIADVIGVRYMKLRSGTSASAVNQAAERALTIVLVP